MEQVGLSMEEEQVLILAMLDVFLDWPECTEHPVSWVEMAERMPDQPRYSPGLLQFYTYRCSNDGFLRGFSREDDTFQIDGLTGLGKRMLREEFALAQRMANQTSPRGGGLAGGILTLIALAIRLWLGL